MGGYISGTTIELTKGGIRSLDNGLLEGSLEFRVWGLGLYGLGFRALGFTGYRA